jgi:hypothetical protein
LKEENMNFAKRLLMVTGTVALAGVLSVMLTPKAVYAVVSTLVTVVNTSANSVPTSDGGAAHEPFEFEAIARPNSVNEIIGTFTVPSTTADGRTVQRLVIEEVTAQCSGLSAPAAGIRVGGFPFSGAGAHLGFGSDDHYFPFPNNPASGQQVLAQETRIYVDPGVTVIMNTFEAFENSGGCAYTASGHFIVQ